MTGPDHYAEAERLLALAERHSSGATYGPEWTLTLAAAQVHAILALAAATATATAGGIAGPDSRAWADVTAARLSVSMQEAPDAGGPESGSAPPRPPPLFPPPPEPGPRY